MKLALNLSRLLDTAETGITIAVSAGWLGRLYGKYSNRHCPRPTGGWYGLVRPHGRPAVADEVVLTLKQLEPRRG